MKKFQYSVWRQETNDAGGKAKRDAYDILCTLGFAPSYLPSRFRIIRIVQQIVSTLKISKDSMFLVQYPAVDFRVMKLLSKKIRKFKISVALVHDLVSIQGLKASDVDDMLYLNCFKYLIVHNDNMKTYIQNLGYNGSIIVLGVFDYLHDVSLPIKDEPYSNSICYAGNLNKSAFILNLSSIKNINFNLYGKCDNTVELNKENVNYYGVFPSDKIVYELQGDYGLVWDGSSLNTCDGQTGSYLLYNTPHKLSLYIAAGKPIIAWKKAAISRFIIDNDIGFVVDSLDELVDRDLSYRYEIYKKNVLLIKTKIANGHYLVDALDKIK